MTECYSRPQQERAKNTEQKFLAALDDLLKEKSFGLLTIEQIAERACLTRSAFLKRFGTKKQALVLLYEKYCARVSQEIQRITDDLPAYADAMEACYQVSKRAEALQQNDFSANRAMHELFMEELAVASQTKRIFREAVVLMQKIQRSKMPVCVSTDIGAYAAAQLVFTINYNHVLKAMPGLPRDAEQRHQLIASLLVNALKY